MSSRNRWINRLAKRSVVASAAAAATSTLLSTSAWAVTGTWITTSSAFFSSPAAWIFAVVPGSPQNIANFTAVDLSPGFAQNPNNVQHLQVSLTTNTTLGSLVFADTNTATPGDWSLVQTAGAGTLILDNGSDIPTINVGNLGNLATSSFAQIDVPIIVTGVGKGMVKQGGGELRLTKSNDFGGGTISVNGGTLSIGTLDQIGNAKTTLSLGGGTLSLRNNATFDMSGYQLNVTANSGLNIDRAIGSALTGQSIVDKVGTISLNATNVGIQIRGSTNGYGLNLGTLIFAGGGSQSFFSDLAPASITIGNVVSPSGGTLTFSGTGDASGSDVLITSTISQTSTTALSIAYTDSHTLNVGSFGAPAPTGALTVSGSGTLLVTGSNAVIPSATLTVSDGTLNFQASTLGSTVGTILMGSGGSTAAYVKMGPGGLTLNTHLTYSAGNSTNPSAPGIITGASGATFTLASASAQTFNIGQITTTTGIPGRDFLIDIPVALATSGTMVKSGLGELVMSGANKTSGTINVSNGTLTSVVRTSGSSLGANTASGTVIISSGNLRIVSDGGVSGSSSAGTLLFTGDLKPAQLVVDASVGGGQASLNLGTFGGRLSGSGVLTIIPVSGPLNATEHINVVAYSSTVDPSNNHGIIAPFVAAQQSATNSAMDFVGRVGGVGVGSNNLVAPAYTTFTGSESGSSAVVVRTSDFVDNSFGSVFAIKVGNGANISGGGFLQLGDGTRSGAILNDGAQLSISNLLLTSAESVFWSGGTTTGGTVGSVINLNNAGANNLTTGGAQTLTFSSTINLGNNSRTITVGSGTTLFSGNVFQGNLNKSGAGVLLMTGTNPTFAGTLTVSQGTISIGVGGDGSLGTGSVDTGVTATGVGTLQFNLSGTRTITNFMTGAGTILQNSSSGGILVLKSSSAANTYQNLAILNGGVQLNADSNIPAAATMTVSGGSFDLNGFNQTINALAGGVVANVSTGLITNSQVAVKTLTLNPSSTTSATYSGTIAGGSSMRIIKIGTGTQQLSGNNDYTGGTTISFGTLSVGSNNGLGHDASVVLNNANGAVLRFDPNGSPTLPASLSISISNGTGTVSVGTINGGGNSGTISGPIVGTGTFVISNQDTNSQLTVSGTSLDTMYDPNTLTGGTVLLSRGGIRFNAAGGSNVSNPSINFNFAGTGVVSTVNAATVRLGNISGGANTTITAVGGSVIQLGAGGGAQAFGGTINGNVTLSKIGTGTLTLNSRTSSYSGVTNVLGGALVLSNYTLSGTPTINIVGGPLIMTGAASISATTAINLSEAFNFDVTTHQGWSTPANVTIQGTGLITGRYTHNSGSMIVGNDGGLGSITFTGIGPTTFGDSVAAAPGSSGVTLLDFTSVGAIGGGSNDLITVSGDIGLNSNALFRVNNLNTTHNFTANETYPAILYSGSKLTGLNSAVSSAFRGSFALVDVPDNINFPGYHIIGVKVVSFSTTPSISTWTGSVTSTWDLNITKNFVDSTGSTTFFQGDSVVFDNSILGPSPVASGKSINLANALILPGTLTFGNTSNLLSYTVQGNGVIGGGARVLINGGGSVNMNATNSTYTGGTVVNSGWLTVNGGGVLNGNGALGVGSLLLNGGSSGQSATLVFAANANPNNPIFVPTGQIANLQGLGSMGTGGKLTGTFNLTGAGQRWDLYTLLQTPTDPATGTILINANSTVRLMRPYAGAGLFINFASGQGGVTTNLFDILDTKIFIGGLSGVGSGNLTGFGGGNPASYKEYMIGGANADSTWGGNTTDSGAGNNNSGVSNTHSPTAITKQGTATLKLNGVSVGMSGLLQVNSGTMIIDSTDSAQGTRIGGGLMMNVGRVQVNSGATFQIGSGGADGQGSYIGDNNSTAGTFGQASSTGTGVLWNANNATINLAQGYTSLPSPGTTVGTNVVNLPTVYDVDPNLTISGSNAKIWGNTRLLTGTLSPGDGGSGRFGTMTVYGVDNTAMQDPNDVLDVGQASSGTALTLNGGGFLLDLGSSNAVKDSIVVSAGGGVGNGNFVLTTNSNNRIVLNFNGNSAAAGQTYDLVTAGNISAGTLPSEANGQLILNGRNAHGNLGVVGNVLKFTVTSAASASNIEWASSNGSWDVGSWTPGATRSWANTDTSSSADYFYNGDNITFNPAAVAGGTVNIGRSVAPNVVTVNTNLGTNTVAYTFSGKGRITGNASVVKNGNGTLTVRNDNDYSGGTTINAGTLDVGASPTSTEYFPGINIATSGIFYDSNQKGSLGTGSVFIGSGGTLAFRVSSGVHMTNFITGPGAFIEDVLQGALSLDTQGSWTGGTVLRGGYMRPGVDNAFPSAGSLQILTTDHPTRPANGGWGGRFDLYGHSQSVNELYGNGAFSLIMNQGSISLVPSSTMTIGSGNFAGAVHQGQEGNPQGTFAQIALVKFSSGTLTMNYLTNPISAGGTLTTNVTGLTDVKGGLLVVRGVHEPNGVPALTNTAMGSYTVRNGASIGGDGTIRAQINIESGGILAPGLPDSSVHTGGTLTINGLNLTSSVLNFDLRGIDNDQVDIQTNNTLTALGTSTININVDNTLVTQPGTYQLIDYRGTAFQNFASRFTLGTITNGGSILTYSLVHNTTLTEIDLVVSQPTVTSTWNVGTGGSWAVANNWSSVGTITLAPNSVDSVANLTAPASMGVNPTITVDNTVTLKTLNLATANGKSFTINKISNGSFNFNSSSGGVGINTTSGSHVINVPTAFSQDTTINVSASTLTLQQSLDAPGMNVTVSGGGQLVVGNVRNTSGFNGSTNFRITGNTKVQLKQFAPSNPVNGASKVNTLSIDDGSSLDLTNNALVLDYATTGQGTALLSSVRGLIVNGYNTNPSLNTAKIRSTSVDATHALGYRDNQGTAMNVKDPSVTGNSYRSLGSVSDQAGAGGVSIDTTSIIIKYTYKGDTNLDGMVDINDLLNVATHFNQTPPGGDGWLWQQGDFDYNGTVNTADLQYIGANWLQGTGSIPNTQLSPLLAALGLPNVAVPEPTSLGLVGIGLTGLMARRRRRQS